MKWAASSEFGTYCLCEQRRFRRACASRTSAARSYRQWVKRNLQTESQIPGLSESVKICHDRMLEDTNSLDGAQIVKRILKLLFGLRQANLCLRDSVMTNFNCACQAIQRGQGSGFLSEDSSWLAACMSEQRRFWRDCEDAQARLNLHCSHRR